MAGHAIIFGGSNCSQHILGIDMQGRSGRELSVSRKDKGADAARSVIRTLPTPAAQLFHRGVTYSFPSIFTQHSALFVARILLQLFSDDAYEETCTACRRPLYTHDGSGTIQVREFVPTPCKHGMHLSCRQTLEEHCQAYGLAPHCLQCTELLPPYTVPPLHADVVSTPSLKV